jgi:hypothetical protein
MSSLPAGSFASKSEVLIGIVAPVLQIIPELQELCEEPNLLILVVHLMADSLEALKVPLSPAPPL